MRVSSNSATGPSWMPAAVIVVLLLVSPCAEGAQREVNQGGSVHSDAEIEIYNVAGSITITGWDRDEVRVNAILGEGTDRLDFENDGATVEITVVVERRRRRDPERRVGESHLEIMVPRNATLDVEALASSITVTGVSGDVRMDTSAGQITFAGDSSEIEADTSAGNIEITTTSNMAEIDAENMAGNVTVQVGGGEVMASTVTGNIRVVGGRFGDSSFESTSGGIYFEGEIGPDAEFDFENFDGDIDLLIPENTAASFEITTQAGTIDTEFGYEGRRVEQYTAEQEAEFTLGDGADASVSIETFGGNVTIRKR